MHESKLVSPHPRAQVLEPAQAPADLRKANTSMVSARATDSDMAMADHAL